MTDDVPSREGVELFAAEFPNRVGAVWAIRDQVAAVARECGLGEQAVKDVRLAVSEAATNAIIHGHASAADATVLVRVETAGNELCVVISDQGRGMLPRDDSPGLGLGLLIMSTVAQRMEVVSPGVDGRTEVRMYFPFATPD